MLLAKVKYLLFLKCFFKKTLLIAFISVLCLSKVTILTEVKVKAVRTHISFLVKGNKHTVCVWLVMVPEHEQVAFLISLFEKACMQTLKRHR